MKRIELTPARRRFIYRFLIALAAVAVVYGRMSHDEAAQWLGLAAVVLGGAGNVLADRNVPTSGGGE